MRTAIKKIAILLFVLCIVTTGFLTASLPAAAEASSPVATVIGDATGNDELDVKDLVRFKKVLSSIDGAEFAEGFEADLNADEVLNDSDIHVERRLILNISYNYSDTTWAEIGGTTMFAHGSINAPANNPGWETRSVDLATGEEAALVRSGNYMHIAAEEKKTGFLHRNGYAATAEGYDLVYVYTMPCKAKIDLTVNASVQSDDTDGAVVYAYVNDTSNCVINRTVVTNTSNTSVASKNGLTLNACDKLYLRLNKKESAPQAATVANKMGYFYGKIVFAKEKPDAECYKGESLADTSWREMAGKVVQTNSDYFGTEDAPFETIALNLSTGKETSLYYSAFTGRTQLDYMYITGEDKVTPKPYLRENGQAWTSAEHDLMYVYTMPCDAVVNLEMVGRVNTVGSGNTGDGIVMYCYRNDTTNCIVNRTPVEYNTTSPGTITQIKKNTITLKKGDKLYFRLNKNETNTDDNSNFYAKITFVNTKPGEEAYQGEAYK